VLVIVNKYGPSLTGNLQGPLVVNTKLGIAEQLVLADQRWSTRHKLLEVAPMPERAPAHAASA
jgi:flagellar assembly factor FliW